jgi:hypothetical protein
MTVAGRPKVEALTAAQRASFVPFVAEWLDRVLATGPLQPAARDAIVSGIRRCYEMAGMPWPGRVVWVPSPFVGAAAAAVAGHTLQVRRDASPSARRRRWRTVAGRASLVTAATIGGMAIGGMKVHGADFGGLPVGGDVNHWLGWVIGGVGGGYIAGRGLLEWLEDRDARDHQPQGEWWRPAAWRIKFVSEGLMRATVGAAEVNLRERITPAVDKVVRDRVQRPIVNAEWPIRELSGTYPDRSVHADSRELLDHVRSAVCGAIGEPVVAGEPEPRLVTGSFVHKPPATGWIAPLMWWHRHGQVPIPRSLLPGVNAYAAAARVQYWPHRDFVIASEPPIELHRPIRPGVDGRRLHRIDGPAVRWQDGSEGFVRDGRVDPAAAHAHRTA